MEIVYIGIGFMMLLSGRPAYWVFTGGIAFLLGNYLAVHYSLFTTEWNNLILSLLFAIFGVFLAFLFHRWTARVAGFIAGGYLVYFIPAALGSQSDWATPLYFGIAGTIALLLLFLSFDFALILISALTAVTFILRFFWVGTIDQGAMFLILTVFSLITQYLIMQYVKPSPD